LLDRSIFFERCCSHDRNFLALSVHEQRTGVLNAAQLLTDTAEDPRQSLIDQRIQIPGTDLFGAQAERSAIQPDDFLGTTRLFHHNLHCPWLICSVSISPSIQSNRCAT
jgi:hypothetical protein